MSIPSQNHLLIKIILSIVLTTPTFSQLSEMRVVGTPKEEPSELVSKDIRDANGEVCAGLIIFSDLTGLKFQASNGIVKTNRIEGKDFLFVSSEERVIEVFCSGYAPLKIILSEHGVRLKSGSTWSLKITGEKKLDLLPVTFQIEPTDAILWIDGVDKGAARTIQLGVGDHLVRAVKDGFKTEEKKISVSTANVLFTLALNEVQMSAVKFRSIPKGAQIFIDNLAKGETDKDLFLYPGEYGIKISKSGYVDAEKRITVTENGVNLVSMTLEKNIGTLMLAVTPPEARVLINKEDYTNKSSVELAPGRYKIEVQKEGYNGQSETIELSRGQKVKKHYALGAKTGTLQFSVQPVDARVEMMRSGGAAYSWEGAAVQKGIPVGHYDLQCRAAGYRPVTKSIMIEENKALTEEIVMKKGLGADALPGNRSKTRKLRGMTDAEVRYWSTYVIAFEVCGNYLFAATTFSGLFRSSNNGKTWDDCNAGLPWKPDNTLKRYDKITGLAVVGQDLFRATNSGLYHSADLGETWSPIKIPEEKGQVSAIAASETTIFVFINGGIYCLEDDGITWRTISKEKFDGASYAVNDSTLWIGHVMYEKKTKRLTWNGASWKTMDVGLENVRVMNFSFDRSNVYAGGLDGVYRSTDNGLTWTELLNERVQCVAVVDHTVLVGESFGRIKRSTDGGETWTELKLAEDCDDVVKIFVSGNKIYAAIYRGGIYQSSDLGGHWNQICPKSGK